MPSPTNALTLIERALALTNSVGTDQTLTAAETADCLAVFNDIIEEWSLDSLTLWDSANQSFSLVPGKAIYTCGPGGDFAFTARPINIHQPMYTVLNGATGLGVGDVSFPCVAMTQEEYNLIAVKGQQQQYPDRYLFLQEFSAATPLSQITFWPIPSAANLIYISSDRVLTQAANAATNMSFPPGYAKAFLYTLAVELAPQFSKEAKESVQKKAISSLAAIKKANQRSRVAQFDVALRNLDYINWQSYYQ